MFDRYTRHTHEYGGPERVDVHEHRAPTDASVKMLRELEEAAFKRVLRTFEFENSLKMAIVETSADALTSRVHLRYMFELNGEEYTGAVPLAVRGYLAGGDTSGLAEYLVGEVAKVLAHKLLSRAGGLREMRR
jgi:hypothetical protein